VEGIMASVKMRLLSLWVGRTGIRRCGLAL
jgi:hypothetical protein